MSNFSYCDPHTIDSQLGGAVDFDFDAVDRAETEQPEPPNESEITREAAELVWQLLTRPAQVNSVSAHALWFALQYQSNAGCAEIAREHSVSKQAVATAVKRARADLEQVREQPPMPDGVTIRFRRPVLIHRPTRRGEGVGSS